jgi:hypothetical protein
VGKKPCPPNTVYQIKVSHHYLRIVWSNFYVKKVLMHRKSFGGLEYVKRKEFSFSFQWGLL